MLSNHKLIEEAFVSFNWLSLFPDVNGKKIVYIGYKRKELLEAYMPSSTIETIDFSTSNIHQLTKTSSSDRDIIIIDENIFLDRTMNHSHFVELVGVLNELLGDNGIFLFIFPKGLGSLRIKYKLKSTLKLFDFDNVYFYLCSSSCSEPFSIYSFCKDKKFTFKFLFADFFNNRRNKSIVANIKLLIKYISTRIHHRINPFIGMMFYASKTSKLESSPQFEKNIHCTVPHYDWVNNYYMVWLAKPFKYIGLFYDTKRKNIKTFICKRSLDLFDRSDLIRQENQKLILLNKHCVEFKDNSFEVPIPICLKQNNGTIYSIETALSGKTLETYKWQLNNKEFDSFIYERLDELVEIQIYIQDNLSFRYLNDFPCLSREYYNDKLNIVGEEFTVGGRINSYARNIQHGDFTDVNIIYNYKEKLWGIIDWEWSASGFPYMFDLFCLFTSLEFRSCKKGNEPLLSHYYISFIATYFQDNIYSSYIREKIKKYCYHYSLDIKDVFGYFLDYLLFHYNKYHNFKSHEYAELYQKCMKYSIKHFREFVI